jgi:hypothetical protein
MSFLLTKEREDKSRTFVCVGRAREGYTSATERTQVRVIEARRELEGSSGLRCIEEKIITRGEFRFQR